MNSSHSPLVTSRSASRKGWTSTSWRGASLSQANPSPSWPTERMPPGKSIQPGAAGSDATGLRSPWAIGGTQRIGGKQRQDVRQQQLLVLLLVVDADLDEPGDLCVDAAGEQRPQAVVHMGAIGHDPLARRPCEQPPLGARLPRALALVVGVEAVVEAVVEHPVAGQVLGKDKCFKEPRHMREVPLRRARILHRLDRHVLRR